MKVKTKQDRRRRRHQRIRRKVSGSAACPRLAVMVSNRAVAAQLIDDEEARTLCSASTGVLGAPRTVDGAKLLGQRIGETAKEKGIERFVFDRGGFAYHGRVAAVVEGALAAGLTNKKEKK